MLPVLWRGKLRKALLNLFDINFYKRAYDLDVADENALEHYIRTGIRLGWDPCPEINLSEVCQNVPELRPDKILIELSKKSAFYFEQRSVSPQLLTALSTVEKDIALNNILKIRFKVNEPYYYENNSDVAVTRMPAYVHYALYGWKEGRKPTAEFDTQYYMDKNPSVDFSKTNPFIHFVDNFSSWQEFFEKTEFDEEYYLQQTPELMNTDCDVFSHYISTGESQGKCPNKFFSPVIYKQLYPDVRAGNDSLFEHFRSYGLVEGRIGNVSRERPEYIDTNMLIVGHDALQAGAQQVLLEILRWVYIHRKNWNMKLVLLGGGTLLGEYSKYADVYVLAGQPIDDDIDLLKFLDERFDIVYLNTVVSGRFLPLAEKLDVSIDCPVIAHIHEMQDMLEQHDAEMTALKSSVSHWISASPASTDALRSHYDISKDNMTTIAAFIRPLMTGVDYRKTAREELGYTERDFVVAGCGTLCDRKGTDIFANVARLMNDQKKSAKFLWIGSGGADKSDYVHDAEDQFLNFLGYRKNANELLACADVFFLSSREDPFPLVVLEAAQHAVPTVYFEGTTGIHEFIKHDAGYSISAINEQEACSIITSIMNSVKERKRLGLTAKNRVLESYTADLQCSSLITLLEKR